jgi:hypothetical protein
VILTRRAVPWVLGVGAPIALFGVLAWDLAHHSDGHGSRWSAIYILAPIWSVSLAPIVWRWFRRRKSEAWPWAPARIEGGAVEAVQRGRRQMYELTVTYSYAVGGETYGGVYRQTFGNAIEAQDLLTSMRDLPPPTRYRPSDPSDSVMDPYRDAGLK